MPTDTALTEFVINKLTRSQYKAIDEPSETELYFVTDDDSISLDDDGNPTMDLGTSSTFIINNGKGIKLTWGIETGNGSISNLNGVVKVNGVLQVPSSSTMIDASNSKITWTEAELKALIKSVIGE